MGEWFQMLQNSTGPWRTLQVSFIDHVHCLLPNQLHKSTSFFVCGFTFQGCQPLDSIIIRRVESGQIAIQLWQKGTSRLCETLYGPWNRSTGLSLLYAIWKQCNNVTDELLHSAENKQMREQATQSRTWYRRRRHQTRSKNCSKRGSSWQFKRYSCSYSQINQTPLSSIHYIYRRTQ